MHVMLSVSASEQMHQEITFSRMFIKQLLVHVTLCVEALLLRIFERTEGTVCTMRHHKDNTVVSSAYEHPSLCNI